MQYSKVILKKKNEARVEYSAVVCQTDFYTSWSFLALSRSEEEHITSCTNYSSYKLLTTRITTNKVFVQYAVG